MVDGIDTSISLGQLQGLGRPQLKAKPLEEGPGKVMDSFGQLLKNHLEQVNKLDEEADTLIQDYAVGKPVELHNVIIAHEKADMAMELTMQLRNKGIAAYQEIWRMNL